MNKLSKWTKMDLRHHLLIPNFASVKTNKPILLITIKN